MDKPPISEDAGGSQGGGTRRQRMSDTLLVERAIAEAWPIPADLRPLLIRRLAHIVTSDNSSPREQTSAAKALLAASKINLESIATVIRAEEHEQLVEDVEYLKRKMNK